MNDWTAERLTRAALGSLLSFCTAPVLRIVARFGPDEAWERIRNGHTGDGPGQAGAMLPGVGGCEPAASPNWRDVRGPGGQAFAAWAAQVDPARVAERTDSLGLRFIIPGDAEWPPDLAGLGDCAVNQMGGFPVGLWVVGPGDLAQWSRSSVAMVGSRSATRYGESVALRFASELATSEDGGWTVISGGAFGIDAASHRGALLAGGPTVAVCANGLDKPYPPGNAALIESIRVGGLLVSELPPGSSPNKAGFLQRNRIIAALSQGTVVIEAALRSGARNTASWANALGRTVMAVPGPVTSAMSVTPHNLIRDGEASLVATSDDVRTLLAPMGRGPVVAVTGQARPGEDLSAAAMAVREALPGRGALSLSEVALISGESVPRCLQALHELATNGLAARNEDGYWRLQRPGPNTPDALTTLLL